MAIAKEETYIREYTYQASETDSKVSARKTSLLLLKEKLLSEIGTIVNSNVNIFNSSTGVKVSSQQVQSLTQGFIKTEILQEKWNGVTFVVKARLLADPDAIAEKLKAIVKASRPKSASNEEFEYWKTIVKIDATDGYLAYMSKYPNGKYQDLALIAMERIKKSTEREATNKQWLTKANGKVVLVVRHDTGGYLDNDNITRQMGDSASNIIKKYLSTNSSIEIISDFNVSKLFKYNQKNYSQTVCGQNQADLVAGVMLDDHEGSGGMHRPVKLFIYNCLNENFKITNFVPSSSSKKDFWRDKAMRKNMRVFIEEYIDGV